MGGETGKRRQQRRLVLTPAAAGAIGTLPSEGLGDSANTHLEISPPRDEGLAYFYTKSDQLLVELGVGLKCQVLDVSSSIRRRCWLLDSRDCHVQEKRSGHQLRWSQP